MALRHVLIAVSLVSVAFASTTVLASHDTSECELEAPPGETISVADLYVNDRGDPPGTGLVTGNGTWIYQESNGLDGLQLVEDDPDSVNQETCGHGGDTLIF